MITKWDLMELRSYFTVKDIQTKSQPEGYGKTFTKSLLDIELIFKLHKELQELYIKKPANKKQTKITSSKWAIILNREFSDENQMIRKHLKNLSTSLDIREKQIRTTLRSHLTLSGTAKMSSSP